MVGLLSVCDLLREGDKRHFRLSRVLYSSPSLALPVSCFLYEVRAVRVARKINNYEARGDDSNGEIKVSQSKVILRILRVQPPFVLVFDSLSKLFASSWNTSMIVNSYSTGRPLTY